MTAEESAQEQKLGASLSQLNQQLFRASDPKAIAEIRKRLEVAERSMDDFHMRLYLHHPQLAAQRGDAAPIKLSQTSALLPDDQTALVEFTATEDTLYIFTIVRGPHAQPVLRTHKIAWSRTQLAHEVNELLDKVAARNLDYRAPAERLYRRLLGPAERELSHCKLLVLVPDGPLWNLPFQTLIAPDHRYLVEKQAVFYAPSLTYLLAMRNARSGTAPAASRQLLALGNPDTAALPESEREVRQLVNLYGSDRAKPLIGPDASKATWQRLAPSYRILHVATHGILNADNPMYSYLVLSGKTSSDKTLEAREVLNMNLHSDLIVLSACETGRGRVSLGEGLVGMSWAFLLAGRTHHRCQPVAHR